MSSVYIIHPLMKVMLSQEQSCCLNSMEEQAKNVIGFLFEMITFNNLKTVEPVSTIVHTRILSSII